MFILQSLQNQNRLLLLNGNRPVQDMENPYRIPSKFHKPILSAFENVPCEKKYQFINGIRRAFQYHHVDPNLFVEMLPIVVSRLRDMNSHYLPQEALLNLSFFHASACSESERHFIDAYKIGTLVETNATIGGKPVKIYIKGVWDQLGKALAYSPDLNEVFSINVTQGSLVDVCKCIDNKDLTDALSKNHLSTIFANNEEKIQVV